MQNVSEKLPLKQKVMFAMGDIYGGGSFNIVNFFYAIFLTDVIRLNPLWVAPIMLISRIVDAVTDPLMGYISDHTHSRWGRRRPYFLFGIGLVFLSFFMLWFPVDFSSETGKFLFVLFAYIFFNLVVTMVMVPYQAMSAEMTLDYKERTSLSAMRMLFSMGATLICALVPYMIIFAFDDIRQGYMVMAAIFGAFFALPWIGVFLYSRERAEFQLTEKSPRSVRDFLLPLKIRTFRKLVVMYLAIFTAMDAVSLIFAYLMRYYLQLDHMLNFVLGTLVLTQIVFVPVALKIANSTSKIRGYIIGAGGWIIFGLISLLMGPGQPVVLIFLLAALFGATISIAVVLVHSLFGDVTDVGELQSGLREEGSFGGIMTFIRKVASAVANGIIMQLLGVFGYLEPLREVVDGVNVDVFQVQNNTVIWCIRLVLALAPLILLTMGILTARTYKLSPERHAFLSEYLGRKRRGEPMEPELETKAAELKAILI